MADATPYLYRLTLRPELQGRAMTPEERAIQQRHLEYLLKARDRGAVILAGRTDEPPDRSFGLVLFQAASETEARTFMANDPAVAGGLMNATLYPFRLAVAPKQPPD
jgi:uncharacterized protein